MPLLHTSTRVGFSQGNTDVFGLQTLKRPMLVLPFQQQGMYQKASLESCVACTWRVCEQDECSVQEYRGISDISAKATKNKHQTKADSEMYERLLCVH